MEIGDFDIADKHERRDVGTISVPSERQLEICLTLSTIVQNGLTKYEERRHLEIAAVRVKRYGLTVKAGIERGSEGLNAHFRNRKSRSNKVMNCV